jgi:3-oxoacyl-[acyl-carrier protein] reductase
LGWDKKNTTPAMIAIYKVPLLPINVKDIFMGLKEAATRLHDNGQVLNLSSSVTCLILSSDGLYSGTKAAV